MTEVISVRFRNRGKAYFFSPNGKTVKLGDKVIVETSKGLEIADCTSGNHMVDDSIIIQPLRPMVRFATNDDLRIAKINSEREKEAFDICLRKIEEHELQMKLVDVECSFDGNKTTFFFTSENRVDFRELVKDLAAIFRNRIELRQIGVRDEARMIGGLGICGRPFCCSRFLDDFQPVSTKMAKIQSMSLNPSKISGTCGRLMCCLRYEQEAYEELVRIVPKQGTFVETPAGYGTVTQVNLLRHIVKVKLDDEGDDSIKTYRAEEIAAVPGGRPKDGEIPPSVLQYIHPQEPEEEFREELWDEPEKELTDPEREPKPDEAKKKSSGKRRRNNKKRIPAESIKPVAETKPTQMTKPAQEKQTVKPKPKHKKSSSKAQPANTQQTQQPKQTAQKQPAPKQTALKTQAAQTDGSSDSSAAAEKKKSGYRRRYYHHSKPKAKNNGGNAN